VAKVGLFLSISNYILLILTRNSKP